MIQPNLRALTPEQLDAYHRDGYHIARGLFSADEAQRLIDLFMGVVADGPVEGLSDVHRITDHADPLWQYGRLMHPHLHGEMPRISKPAMAAMLDPRIEAILHDLFGEPALAGQSMVYFKPPGARGQDFHQDNFYLRVKPGTCMAAWLALDRADPDNGGMQVVPGSHKLDVVCPENRSDNATFFTGHHVDTPDGMEKVPAILEPGDCLFFNGQLIHGSMPNTSADRFRRAFICHYMPASCVERSGGYKLFDFDANPVERAAAEGGGPCGDVVPAPARPH